MQEIIGETGARAIALAGLFFVVAMICGVIYNAWKTHSSNQEYQRNLRREFGRRYDDPTRSGDDFERGGVE